jgi:hypothetical protein
MPRPGPLALCHKAIRGQTMEPSGALSTKSRQRSDVIAVIFGALSLGFSGYALWLSNRTSEKQTTFEQEQSAPVLAPGTPPELRGRIVTVNTDYRKVLKRADRMLLRRAHRGHIVVPMRNGGSGIALTVGLPVVVEDCDREPKALPASTVGLLGTYALPSGSSDQLAYFQPRGPKFRAGSVEVGGQRLSYGWDYAHFGVSPKPASQNLLLWCTDGARRKLRWTCTAYSKAEKNPYGRQYVVQSQIYGSKDFPEGVDTVSP